MRRLVPYYRPYVGMLVAGLALVVGSSALGAVVPWLLRSGKQVLRFRDQRGRWQEISFAHLQGLKHVVEPDGTVLCLG